MPCVIAKMHWIRTSRREFAPTHRNEKYSAHHNQSLKIFLQPFIRSTSSVQKFLHPFDCIRSKIFVIRLSARPHPFKHFRHPFIHSVVPLRMAWLSISHPFACRTFACLAFVRKERFLWEVTFDNLEFGKINYCFGKSLDFWVQKSVRTLRVVSSSNPFKIGDKLPFWPKKVERV